MNIDNIKLDIKILIGSVLVLTPFATMIGLGT